MSTGVSKASLQQSLALTRKRFRLLMYLTVVLVILVLIVNAIMRQVYTPPHLPFISSGADQIVFEVVSAITQALIGSIVVAILFDEYQARYAERRASVDSALETEGIVNVYRNANDPRLLETLESAISEAQDKVVALGLGLGILHNNRNLLACIASRINKTSNLTFTVYTGGASNPGVNNRIAEEQAWHLANGVNYDPGWVTKFPNEIRTVTSVLTETSRRHRVAVTEVDSCPMLGIIYVDGRYFYFPYGSPAVRGSESPWLEFSPANATSSHFASFFERTLQFY